MENQSGNDKAQKVIGVAILPLTKGCRTSPRDPILAEVSNQSLAPTGPILAEMDPRPLKAAPVRTVTAIWIPKHEDIFLDILIKHVKRGELQASTFSKRIWSEIYAEFFNKTNKSYNKKQFRNKYNRLRQRYRNFKVLVAENGFYWDRETNNVTADDLVWEEYIQANRWAKAFRAKGCPDYPKLGIVFGGATTEEGAGGLHSTSIESSYEVHSLDDDQCVIGTQDRDSPIPPPVQPFDSNEQNSTSFIPTLVGRRRKGGDIIETLADAINNLATASFQKYAKVAHPATPSSSTHAPVDRYSMSNCISELLKIEGVSKSAQLEAITALSDKVWREAFICMDDELRKLWLSKFE